MNMHARTTPDPNREPTRYTQAQLVELAQDTPRTSREISDVNDFYGHGLTLKRFAGYPLDAPVAAIIEHGPYIARSTWEKELNGPADTILVYSRRRRNYLKPKTDKRIIAIGPLLHYASPLLDEAAVARERQRLGTNVLLFPVHSTHYIRYSHDRQALLDATREAFPGHTLRVCLGWKEILDHGARFYLDQGIDVVTAGNFYDPQFLPRLKSLLEIADHTVSNCIGTHVGYSIIMGKPHSFLKQEFSIDADDNEKGFLEQYMATRHRMMELAERIFSGPQHAITDEQTAFVAKCYGTDAILSPQEMLALLEDCRRREEHGS